MADFAPADLRLNQKAYLQKNSDYQWWGKIGGVDVYKVAPGLFGQTLAASDANYLSPLFASSPQSEPQMALPGGVIVVFKNSVLKADLAQWAKTHSYVLGPKLPIAGKNIWELQTLPGIANLELADLLLTDPLVETAHPNWWQVHSTR